MFIKLVSRRSISEPEFAYLVLCPNRDLYISFRSNFNRRTSSFTLRLHHVSRLEVAKHHVHARPGANRLRPFSRSPSRTTPE